MADDIFLSPEEQDERAKKWLKDNGPALVIGVALGLGAIFGFNQYNANKLAKAEQASALYTAALNEINDSDISDINAQVAELKENFSGTSYAAKAVLLKARQLSVSDLPAALTELQWVVDNAPELGLQHAARIRQAKVHVVLGDYEEAKALASRNDGEGFDSHYQEVLADISTKQGDFEAARDYYQKAIDSLQSSEAGYAQILSMKMDRLPLEPTSSGSETSEQSANIENDATSATQ